MKSRSLVEAYFDSWPNQRWDRMRECLADRIEFNGTEHDADAFTEGCANGVAWRDVTLIESVVCEHKAALLYDGVDTASGTKMRVGEFLTIDAGKIRAIRAAIMVLD
jgi:ketosteroid isomerase-like protein